MGQCSRDSMAGVMDRALAFLGTEAQGCWAGMESAQASRMGASYLWNRQLDKGSCQLGVSWKGCYGLKGMGR